MNPCVQKNFHKIFPLFKFFFLRLGKQTNATRIPKYPYCVMVYSWWHNMTGMSFAYLYCMTITKCMHPRDSVERGL